MGVDVLCDTTGVPGYIYGDTTIIISGQMVFLGTMPKNGSKLPRSCMASILKILLEEAKTSIVSPR